eukprot:Lithocolla_globosa_v1_NODE_7608_length_924_cov_14.385501.p3 type:complete len:100 gc:universal NODE_7608_length_924_cov_14.385501:448-747(+)
MLINSSSSQNCSTVFASANACFACPVIFSLKTIIERCACASFIRSTYPSMTLIPSCFAAGKKANNWSRTSSFLHTRMVSESRSKDSPSAKKDSENCARV